jgi:hypothetical protein
MGGRGIPITAEGMPMATGRWLGWLLVVVVGGAACGGDGAEPVTEGGERAGAATAPATVAAGNRPLVEEQLAILDASRDPAAYAAVLNRLTAKCRESRIDVADAIVAARRTLVQERGVMVALLDYLRGVDSIVPAGTVGADCTAAAAELGRTIGR